MQFEDILGLVQAESERAALVRLAAQFYAAQQPPGHADLASTATAAGLQERVFDQLRQLIDRQFTNARHPIPSSAAIAQMAIDYCQRHPETAGSTPPPLAPG